MGEVVMEQFSLSEYLKNPTRPIITRDGRSARIICTDRVGRWPIVALISANREEIICSFATDGTKGIPEMGKSDLFFASKKKVYPFKKGDRVLVRDSDTPWNFDYFDFYREGTDYPYKCLYAPYEQCIPLNEHTWKLLGTTDEYKEE